VEGEITQKGRHLDGEFPPTHQKKEANRKGTRHQLHSLRGNQGKRQGKAYTVGQAMVPKRGFKPTLKGQRHTGGNQISILGAKSECQRGNPDGGDIE